jgi:hypothetical protein
MCTGPELVPAGLRGYRMWRRAAGQELLATRLWSSRGVRVFRTYEELVAMFPPEDVTELLGHPIPEPPSMVPVISASFGGHLKAVERADQGAEQGRTAVPEDVLGVVRRRQPAA